MLCYSRLRDFANNLLAPKGSLGTVPAVILKPAKFLNPANPSGEPEYTEGTAT